MTKKIATLWCASALLLGGVSPLAAQYSSSNWPTYPYNPAYETGELAQPAFRKPIGIAKYIPNRIPDYVWKQKVSKERVLAGGGVEMVPVAPYNSDQSETWIAINPTDPKNLVASSNDSRFNGPGGNYFMAIYYSLDGGETWQESRTPKNPFVEPNGRATIFDPGMFFDSQGRAYLSLGMTQLLGEDQEGDNGVFVAYSDDKGKTWRYFDEPVTFNSGGAIPFDDKYLAVADVNQNSPYRDNLYVVWTRFKRNEGIYLARSTDRGETWSPAARIPGGTGGVQSPVPAVGPDGTLYVAWRANDNSNTSVVVQVSKDGGKTWVSAAPVVPQTVRNTGSPVTGSSRYGLSAKQSMRISSYPTMDTDKSKGQHSGRVYIAQSGKDESNVDGIYLTYSDDQGKTWSKSKRIDGNTVNNDVFLPSLSVDPVTGMLSVFYYSSQNDPEKNQGVDGYMAISTDGGETFSHIRLTAETAYINDPSDVSNQGTGNFYWGDYTGNASYNGRIYPCYWMPNSPNGGYFSLNVYTNLLSNAPAPVDNLAGSASAENPKNIKLTWQDPTKNMLGQSLTNFKVIIYRRIKGQGEYQKIGEVNGGAQTYTDTGAEDGVEYEYKIVVVSNELESSDRTVAVVAGGALQPMPPVLLAARPNSDGLEVEFESPEFHIDNTPFTDYHEIALYAGTTKLASIPVSSGGIQAGETSKLLFTVPTKQFHKIQLKAVGKRGDVLTESEPSAAMVAYAGAPLTALNATFDADTDTVAYFTEGEGTKWGRTNKAAASQPFSLTDSPNGNYSSLKEYDVILAPFVVPAASTSLSFDHIAMIEDGDRGEVFISSDFGKTWKWMRTYDMNSSSKFTDNVATSQWDTQSYDVSQYVGDTLYVRFTMKTNFPRNNDGWYIDNVRVDSSPVGVGESVAPTAWLGDVVPNPLTNTGRIEYRLRNNAHVTLEVFNSVGVHAATLVQSFQHAGAFTVPVHVDQLPNGVYFYRLTLDDGTVYIKKFSVVH